MSASYISVMYITHPTENSSSDFVLFQAVSAIREAAMREWPLLPVSEREELRSYLLSYLTTHTELTNYVRGQVR